MSYERSHQYYHNDQDGKKLFTKRSLSTSSTQIWMTPPKNILATTAVVPWRCQRWNLGKNDFSRLLIIKGVFIYNSGSRAAMLCH